MAILEDRMQHNESTDTSLVNAKPKSSGADQDEEENEFEAMMQSSSTLSNKLTKALLFSTSILDLFSSIICLIQSFIKEKKRKAPDSLIEIVTALHGMYIFGLSNQDHLHFSLTINYSSIISINIINYDLLNYWSSVMSIENRCSLGYN